MRSRKTRGLPARMARGLERFERWRRSGERRRIPEKLWSLAVKLADEFGINRTAQALRLDYYSLKQRVESSSCGETSVALAPSFCELVPSVSSEIAEWMVELEDREGTKLRIQYKGGGLSDAALLARSVWSGRA